MRHYTTAAWRCGDPRLATSRATQAPVAGPVASPAAARLPCRAANMGTSVCEIVAADGPERLPVVRALFEEYARGLGFDLGFQGFDEELAGLPGAYAPPTGRLLLGLVDHNPAGCVALRGIGGDVCEMKRLFVRPAFRGQGVGRRLAGAVVAEARAIGYGVMRLDTVADMREAQALYRDLGFHETPAYRYNPLPGATYMELRL